MQPPAKQVSEVPLEAKQPRRSSNLVLVFIMACLVTVVVGLVWVFVLPGPGTQPTREFAHEYPADPWQNPPTDRNAAIARLQTLADALLAYREGPMGGGVRWPATLDELKFAGLLPEDFALAGLLSGRPLAYQPLMPMGHDPERWVMVADVETGWVRSRISRRASKGLVCAAVILGDGSVRMIEGEDANLYGGLNQTAEALR
ncbi:MAG: hypothetical protein IT464_11255 [Planctomycetes bacterium]|nr:hypothetical protein [Planctomycetota bacterium]